MDDDTTVDELVDLGQVVGSAEVVTYRLPVDDAVVGGAEVLQLAPGAAEVVDAFLAGSPPHAAQRPEMVGPDGVASTDGSGDATGLALC